jgi:hypothetical protein
VLGLKKDPAYIHEMLMKEAQKLKKSGEAYRYKPGSVSYNKGKRMSEATKEKVSRTFFTKGHQPWNTKPLAHERLTKDGYLMVKLKNRQYVLKHKWMWESEHGKVPTGYALKFIDVSRLRASVTSVVEKKSFDTRTVLNDFLYAAANPAETTRYKISKGSVSEIHKSSGIWISTAAGSTAAISAAGGSRYPITESRYQFVIRELFSATPGAFQLTGGLFHPSQEVLELENLVEHGILALDGHHGMIQLGYGDKVRFFEGPSLKLAQP